jgi:DNA-binding transcriptional ArsR family regulator
VVRQELRISQPGVSQHLRVLRENGFATVGAIGTRRLHAVDPAPLREVDHASVCETAPDGVSDAILGAVGA